jgi:hypothetical protein
MHRIVHQRKTGIGRCPKWFLAELVENLSDGVVLVRPGGIIEYANRRVREGRTHTLLGRPITDLVAVGYRGPLQKCYCRAIEHREPQAAEMMSRASRPWSCRIVPLLDEEIAADAAIIFTDAVPRPIPPPSPPPWPCCRRRSDKAVR